MTSKRIMFICCFAAAFLAGAALSAALVRHGRRSERHHFTEALNLNKEQSSKMREIWSAAMKESRQLAREGYEEIHVSREKAVREMLSTESLLKYEEILAGEKAAREGLEAMRKELFDRAAEDTRKLLDDKQKAMYDELIAERRNRDEDRQNADARTPEKAK